jgi:hypothetical protein
VRDENVPKFVLGEPEGKRPLSVPRSRFEDNIKMNLTQLVCEDCGLGSNGRLL